MVEWLFISYQIRQPLTVNDKTIPIGGGSLNKPPGSCPSLDYTSGPTKSEFPWTPRYVTGISE